MTPIELVINRLEGAGLRRHGHDSDFMAQCPSHDDQSPSLHVTEADDGVVLLHCIAGCRANQIVDDLGLRLRDLFPSNGRRPGPVKPKLVPVAGGGMATRAERDVIERETLELIQQWAAAYQPPAHDTPEPRKVGRDWERAWDIAAARSGVQR